MSPAPSQTLSKVAFAISLLGFCVFPLCAIGGVLALVEAIRNRNHPKPAGFDYGGWAKGLTGLSFVFSLCLVPSLPMFFAEQQRSKQRECKQHLRAVMSRFSELQDAGVTLPALAAALPGDRHQPYTYVLGDGVTVGPTKRAPEPAELQRQLAKVKDVADPGLRGACPDCTLTIACVGNTDGDDELDLLSLSSAQRYAWGTLRVDPGEAYLHASDYSSDQATVVRFAPSDAGFSP